jgi:epoxyqueuosine reductase QueG
LPWEGKINKFRSKAMAERKTLTAGELSAILNINENTLIKLTRTKEIPGEFFKNRWHYNFDVILKHFRKIEGGASC